MMHKGSRVNNVENQKNERKLYLNLAEILYLKVLFIYFLELFSISTQHKLINHLLVLGRKDRNVSKITESSGGNKDSVNIQTCHLCGTHYVRHKLF